MKTNSKILTAMAMALSIAGAMAPSQAKADLAPIITENHTSMSVWVTIYDPLGRQTDWGCIKANDSRTWLSGNYIPGIVYMLRGQVMDDSECYGNQLADVYLPVTAPLQVYLMSSPTYYWFFNPEFAKTQPQLPAPLPQPPVQLPQQ